MRSGIPIAFGLALGALCAILSPATRAQDSFELSFGRNTPAEQRVRAQVLYTPAGTRFGGYGWVSVHLQNPDQRPHRVDLELSNESMGSGTFTVRKTERLEAGQRARVVLPFPSCGGYCTFAASVDGYSSQTNHSPPRSGQASVLVVCEDPVLHGDWEAALKKSLAAPVTTPPVRKTARPVTTPPGTAPTLDVVMRRPEDLPDRWFLMSGFDLVVVDRGASGLTPERERLLCDHAAGGGRLLLVNEDGSRAGPLREILSESAGQAEASGVVGFGAWFADERRTPMVGVLGGTLQAWLTEPKTGAFRQPPRLLSGPPQDALCSHLVIPGLGSVPVGLFLVLILGFVGLVGGQTWHYVRKKRRPMALLVVVPVTGLSCTGAMLLYGLFSEGLGITGVVRSFTLLDQRTHESTAVATRTLYAGLSPSALVPSPATALYSIDLRPEDDGPHRLRIDLDGGLRIGGAVLPSRTPTGITTVTRGAARERLRFRKKGGAPEVLADSGFTPADIQSAVILRDLSGAWFASTQSGSMRAISQEDASNRLATLRGLYFGVNAGRNEQRTPSPRRRWSPNAEPEPGTLERVDKQNEVGAWIAALTTDLPPGTYVACMREAPSVDGLGLSIDWRARLHLVLGRLAPEDFVE